MSVLDPELTASVLPTVDTFNKVAVAASTQARGGRPSEAAEANTPESLRVTLAIGYAAESDGVLESVRALGQLPMEKGGPLAVTLDSSGVLALHRKLEGALRTAGVSIPPHPLALEVPAAVVSASDGRDLTPDEEAELARQNLALALGHDAPWDEPWPVLLDKVRALRRAPAPDPARPLRPALVLPAPEDAGRIADSGALQDRRRAAAARAIIDAGRVDDYPADLYWRAAIALADLVLAATGVAEGAGENPRDVRFTVEGGPSSVHGGWNVEVDAPEGDRVTVHVNDGRVADLVVGEDGPNGAGTKGPLDPDDAPTPEDDDRPVVTVRQLVALLKHDDDAVHRFGALSAARCLPSPDGRTTVTALEALDFARFITEGLLPDEVPLGVRLPGDADYAPEEETRG